MSIPVSRQRWDLEFGQSVEFWHPWQSTYSWSWSGGRRWEKNISKLWIFQRLYQKFWDDGSGSLMNECTRKKARLWSKSYRKTPKIACILCQCPLGCFFWYFLNSDRGSSIGRRSDTGDNLLPPRIGAWRSSVDPTFLHLYLGPFDQVSVWEIGAYYHRNRLDKNTDSLSACRGPDVSLPLLM